MDNPKKPDNIPNRNLKLHFFLKVEGFFQSPGFFFPTCDETKKNDYHLRIPQIQRQARCHLFPRTAIEEIYYIQALGLSLFLFHTNCAYFVLNTHKVIQVVMKSLRKRLESYNLVIRLYFRAVSSTKQSTTRLDLSIFIIFNLVTNIQSVTENWIFS